MARYIVEGIYPEGNEGSPITCDYVVAESEEQATQMVSDARNASDDWDHDRTETFDAYIERERMRLAEMAAMTIEQVQNSWSETVESLGVSGWAE